MEYHNNISKQAVAKSNRLNATLARMNVMPDSALVDIAVVSALLSRSPASLWRDVAAGRLAPPIRIGGRSVRWQVGAVRAAMQGATVCG